MSPALHPLVCGFTGGGNVALGAPEIFDRLPMVEVDPDELPQLARDKSLSRRAVYKAVFRREQRTNFPRYLRHLTILVNGIYWEPGQPRLVTREDLKSIWDAPQPRLRVIADITCDIGGSIEATVRAATPDAPVYVYGPSRAMFVLEWKDVALSFSRWTTCRRNFLAMLPNTSATLCFLSRERCPGRLRRPVPLFHAAGRSTRGSDHARRRTRPVFRHLQGYLDEAEKA